MRTLYPRRTLSPRFPARIFLFLFTLYGCIEEPTFRPQKPIGEVMGYRPVYRSEINTVSGFGPARSLKKPGKIYIYGQYLLVNELNEGIHLYNNADPKDPQPIGFLRIAGNTDFVMRGNIVYANNYSDLIALDITNRFYIKELSRIAQPTWVADFPIASDYHFFECVDHSKGILVGWEVASIKDPKCYR